MAQRQTVLGFFDTIAEAQQAVQLLLAMGFTRENIELSTQTGLKTPASDVPTAPADADSSSGRFFSALFGSSSNEDRSRPLRRTGVTRPDHGEPAGVVQSWCGTLVTVQIQSATEAKQVADLLDTAGAGNVAVDERMDSGINAIRNGVAG